MTPRIDSEGFYFYTCTECKRMKLAALFAPGELEPQGRGICRLCRGEVNHNHRHPHKPSLAQLPKMAGLL
jgi:hypothetical protein